MLLELGNDNTCEMRICSAARILKDVIRVDVKPLNQTMSKPETKERKNVNWIVQIIGTHCEHI